MDPKNHNGHNDHQCYHHHFLVVAYGIQSHVNPAYDLACRLAHIDNSILVTLSVPLATHRQLFPLLSYTDEVTYDEAISYVPFSDGFDDGTKPMDNEEREHGFRVMSQSLSAVVSRLATQGRAITCIISTMVMPSVLGVAREHDIPLAIYWTQPAIVLAAYYHYFHGYSELIKSYASDSEYEVSLPGLRPLRIQTLPSFLADTMGNEVSEMIIGGFRDFFEHMDQKKTMVLVSTFHDLESTTLKAIQPYIHEIFPIVPILRATKSRIHLFQQDKKGYMEWLSAQLERSVVYISFGSILTYTIQQVNEILQGMHECRRPYLWVVRKDGRKQEVQKYLFDNVDPCNGMVVEWCDQLEVLSHVSVGCFVTHCGWNSTLEALSFGVPMVAVPNCSDQPTNANLIEEEWGVSTRARHNGEGILIRTELARCIETVMGNGDMAMEIREKINAMKEMIHDAVLRDGPCDRSLQSFVNRFDSTKKFGRKFCIAH